jgi:hypothetical protein
VTAGRERVWERREAIAPPREWPTRYMFDVGWVRRRWERSI